MANRSSEQDNAPEIWYQAHDPTMLKGIVVADTVSTDGIAALEELSIDHLREIHTAVILQHSSRTRVLLWCH